MNNEPRVWWEAQPAPKKGDITQERMKAVASQWRRESISIHALKQEIERRQKIYDELHAELLTLEAAFPADFSSD